MKPLSKTGYLLQVKNHMLLHFCHRDIVNVLKDLKEMFTSGKEDGKTEEELCREFGAPKEFVGSLRMENAQDRFFLSVFLYMISAVALYVVMGAMFQPLNAVFWCIPAVAIPLYFWHLCGGRSLCETEMSTGKGDGRKLSAMGAGGMVLVAIQQTSAILLHIQWKSGDWSMVKNAVVGIYGLSAGVACIAVIFFVVEVHRLYQGKYTAFYAMILNMGIICSSLFYITCMRSFNGNGDNIPVCAVPYLLNMIFCMGVAFCFKGRGLKPLWNRR